MQANEKSIWTESFKAGGDLRLKQYFGVKISADRTVILMAADEDLPVGVLLNAPNTGQEALVCVMGRTPVILGDTLTAGAPIRLNAAGKADVFAPAHRTNDFYCVGQITVGGGLDEVGEALICTAVPVKDDNDGGG